jgi:hypothetical protein
MKEEITKIDNQLTEMRTLYVTASPVMKKYYIERAKQLKDKQKRLRNEITS